MKILGKNYYQILGLSSNVSEKEIEIAYRRKVKEFHPDLHKQDQLSIADGTL